MGSTTWPVTSTGSVASVPLALDLVLKSFLKAPAFSDLPDKNWTAISRLIPGTTPKQVQRRYEELLQQNLLSGVNGIGLGRSGGHAITGSTRNATRADGDQRSSRPSSEKIKGSKAEKDQSGKNGDKRPSSADQSFVRVPSCGAESPSETPRLKMYKAECQMSDFSRPFSANAQPRLTLNSPFTTDKEMSPLMVIHVCDEAKNLKQDFNCPRDLLVREMRYFAEYLSTDAQRWEEVDISVHCDVQIFDWLMKYVKRTSQEDAPPKLEPNNVISILISSDFLKMDSLVTECIKYCHENMTAIVATPCNMNCINDGLVGRIADLFTHNEADDVRDRKDKFKSKLFAKKLERLFDSEYSSSDSPESAASLYKCSICKKLLTKTLEKRVKCQPSRLSIDRVGRLTYNHTRDLTWDVNDYLLELKQQLKTWRDVYWRVWGTINSVTCSRCKEVFSCIELGHCRYHAESANYDLSGGNPGARGAIGVYPCCEQKVLRFNPTQPNMGCKVRDHVVSLTDSTVALTSSVSCENLTKDTSSSVSNKVYEDLLAHRDAICVPYAWIVSNTKDEVDVSHLNQADMTLGVEDSELNVFAREEHATGMRDQSVSSKTDAMSPDDGSKPEPRPQPRLQALTTKREVQPSEDCGTGESDDELGEEEEEAKMRPRVEVRGLGSAVPDRFSIYTNIDIETTPSNGEPPAKSDPWRKNLMVLKGVASWMRLRGKADPEGRKGRPPRRSKVTVDPQAILLDAPDFGSNKMRKWDSSRSMRWNQDAQREEDQKRMYEIITYLTKLRVNTEKGDRQKHREYAGGLFCKLEAQWKAVNMPPPRTGGTQIRNKPRLNTLKTTLS